VGDTLAPEAVFWLRAGGSGTLTLSGAPWSAGPRTVIGPGFQAGWGLETLPLGTNLPSGLEAWVWDEGRQVWRKGLGTPLNSASELPANLDAGRAVFWRAAGSTPLPVPESALSVRFYHQDHLGSSGLTTDAMGNLAEETAYFPFGFARIDYQPRRVGDAYKFIQKETDSETLRVYLKSRFLVPDLSRFCSVDRLHEVTPTNFINNPQAWNVYSYCANRSLSLVDPTGNDGVAPVCTEPSKVIRDALDEKFREIITISSKIERIDSDMSKAKWTAIFSTALDNFSQAVKEPRGGGESVSEAAKVLLGSTSSDTPLQKEAENQWSLYAALGQRKAELQTEMQKKLKEYNKLEGTQTQIEQSKDELVPVQLP
jgi:RHS repeat-associated protein